MLKNIRISANVRYVRKREKKRLGGKRRVSYTMALS